MARKNQTLTQIKKTHPQVPNEFSTTYHPSPPKPRLGHALATASNGTASSTTLSVSAEAAVEHLRLGNLSSCSSQRLTVGPTDGDDGDGILRGDFFGGLMILVVDLVIGI